jgi:ATP-dependent Lhr-like helicase
MALSSQLSDMIRQKLEDFVAGRYEDEELKAIAPLLRRQQKWSAIPNYHTLLIEQFHSHDGYHIFMYPFAGRALHEALSALIAWRISQLHPITFSLAFNDYGFELLADQPIPLEQALELDLFTIQNLAEDLLSSINSTQMAKRRFREIAAISGLIFQGYPGKGITNKHLQASAQILYDVFAEYDPDNLLIKQAMEETMHLQVEQSKLADTLIKMGNQQLCITHPPQFTPFAFPIMVDRMRDKISSETLEDRIAKMQKQLEQYAETGE